MIPISSKNISNLFKYGNKAGDYWFVRHVESTYHNLLRKEDYLLRKAMDFMFDQPVRFDSARLAANKISQWNIPQRKPYRHIQSKPW
tara:strand:- start:11177 stop:11437 length:261 start_codon:yes stop_codon:yes gene_type:complete